MDPLDFIYLKGKGTPDLTREKGKKIKAKREKGKGMGIIFEIHSDLTYSWSHARTKRNDFPVGLSPPTSDIPILDVTDALGTVESPPHPLGRPPPKHYLGVGIES